MSRDSFSCGTGFLSLAFAVVLSLWTGQPVLAEEDKHPIALADLSLEELAKLPVTSVSRRPAPLATAAASIYVITGEDIRRSGATSLAEALRLAPNLHVARIDGRNYAITARGFNNSIANKLLVLIDGRTVYSPLFSGVFWDSQVVALEDIERIEVVSGPGSTLWGANAVNGVINVTTRPASDTKGTLLSVGGSMNEHQLIGRYGGAVGEIGHFRVYAKHHEQEDVKTARGFDSHSGFHRTMAGFRTDWNFARQHLTVQGDVMSGRLQQLGYDDIEITGTNLLARLQRPLSNRSDVSVQAYFDHQHRDQPGAINEYLNTIDLDLQHSVRLGRRHNLVWGGGYRHAHDNLHNEGMALTFLPAHFPMNWANLFAQNDIDLFDAVHLTLGAKFERNPYTGWESLPNLRLSWAPRHRDSLFWGAILRSVRSPSRIDRDLFSLEAEPFGQYGTLRGGPEFLSEIAEVLELGYRGQPLAAVSYSVTLFASHYERLRTLEPTENVIEVRNLATAEGYGVEFWSGWQVTDHWRLSAGFVGQHLDVELAPGSRDLLTASGFSYRDPEVFWQLRSSHALTDNLEVEAFFRHVGKLNGENSTPAYSSLDVRCGWQLGPTLKLSVIGQNLLDASHPEFGAAPSYSEFRRALYVKLLWEL